MDAQASPTLPALTETEPGKTVLGLSPSGLTSVFKSIRRRSEALCAPLSVEDYVVQSMPDVSPSKWHLAHTTWFFETFVLQGADGDGRVHHPMYGHLFNSYYNTVGKMHPRPLRGLLSRPSVREVYAYRAEIDQRIGELLLSTDAEAFKRIERLIEIGLHHEQQHQELILTDIKHVLSCNPLRPAYRATNRGNRNATAKSAWVEFAEAIAWIGTSGEEFTYDNERPRHKIFHNAFQIATREVTAGEYIEFIEDGGYRRPELWLSDGWNTIGGLGWNAPMYWSKRNGCWFMFTLSGEAEVNNADPVCHISHYEADAYARWAGARLPTEAEWEIAAHDHDVENSGTIEGNFVEDGLFHPCAPLEPLPTNALSQMYGGVWEWTGSPYTPYPGYAAPEGALGEYNGKFMSNQMVLRGGSCVTPRSHIRRTYRNFFPPDARWQFSGLRLARDVPAN